MMCMGAFMIRKYWSLCVAPSLLLAALPSHAQNFESGDWKVSGYRVGSDGALFALSPAPQSCAGGSNYSEHIKLTGDTPNSDRMFATLMSAYMSGDHVSGIWFSNQGPCSDANLLQVYMIRMKHK